MKYLGINLKDVYTENYKTLMKEIKKTQMESHPMFMVKIYYYSKVHSNQSNL